MSDELAADVRRRDRRRRRRRVDPQHRLLRRPLARSLPAAPSPLVPPRHRALRRTTSTSGSCSTQPDPVVVDLQRPARASFAPRRPGLHREAEPLHRSRAAAGISASPRSPGRLVWRAGFEGGAAFVLWYVVRGGWRDGRHGFIHSVYLGHVPVHDVGEGRNRGARRAADQRRRVRGMEARSAGAPDPATFIGPRARRPCARCGPRCARRAPGSGVAGRTPRTGASGASRPRSRRTGT